VSPAARRCTMMTFDRLYPLGDLHAFRIATLIPNFPFLFFPPMLFILVANSLPALSWVPLLSPFELPPEADDGVDAP